MNQIPQRLKLKTMLKNSDSNNSAKMPQKSKLKTVLKNNDTKMPQRLRPKIVLKNTATIDSHIHIMTKEEGIS